MDIDRHNEEIQRNLAFWEQKPILQKIYRQMHREIAVELNSDIDGKIVELGSGIGNIKDVVPSCLRTDLFPNPWLDQSENAYALSFENETIANLILFDVFHHLRYPGTALREFHRALRPGGRVLIYEPYISQLGKLVYGPLHHEPIAWNEKIEWLAPAGWDAESIDYYAAQGNATRIFADRNKTFASDDWRMIKCTRYTQISYAASGGYSKPQLYPDSAYQLMRMIDNALNVLPSIFATRILVVLEKI
jgi:SAM-dependent methyltransferase